AGAAPTLATVPLPRPGNDLPQVPGEETGQSLSQCGGVGRRPGPLPERASDRGATASRLAATLADCPAPARAGCLGVGRRGPCVSVADRRGVFPGSEAAGASPRRGEVPA